MFKPLKNEWQEKYERLFESNKKLHEAYIRIRTILEAWDTPYAPSSEQVYEITEKKASEIALKAAEIDKRVQDYFIAGFIAAGGDVIEAKKQALQFWLCIEAVNELDR